MAVVRPLFFTARARWPRWLAGRGDIRVNGFRAEKPGREIKLGDVITVPGVRESAVVRVVAAAKRRMDRLRKPIAL